MTKRSKKAGTIDRFLALSDVEKEKISREFDKEFIGDTFRPLSPENRRLWRKAKRKRGRPRVGRGADAVLVSLERTLLKRADAYAKSHGMSRSRLIARALEVALSA
jgi:hypothetical protein